MEECVFSGDDDSQLTSVSYTPRSGEFELSENYIILENEDKNAFKSKCHTYEISASFFCRVLSLVYFFSFISNINQVLGLFGTAGMYDIGARTSSFLQNIANKSFYEAVTEFPSLFLIVPISDFTLRIVPFIGIVASIIMFLTGFNCMYSFLLLWVLKLSMVALFKSVPKTVSDLLLLEVGFLSVFIFSPFKFFDKHLSLDLPSLVKWSFRFLAYRVVLLSGLYKVFLLKKLNIQHILTSIPMPTFFTHFLTHAVTKYKFVNSLLTLVLLFYEVVLSIFLITPYRSCRLFGGVSLIVYSTVFTLLGNFGPFYILLLLSSLFCLDDQFLHPFTQWKFNPFSKSDLLMRKVSIELIESLTQSGDSVEDVENSVEDVDGVDNSMNGVDSMIVRSIEEGTEDSFGSVYIERILSNLSYNRHREYLREFMNLDHLPSNFISDFFKKVLQDLLLVLYLCVIMVLVVLLLLFPHYKGLKSLILFLMCIMLKSHCEAVKTKIALLQGEYTLFLLQSILIFEMVKNGPNTWSFLLWIGVIELQLNLSKKMENLHYLTKMIIQSFLFIHLLLYTIKVFHFSVTEILQPNSHTINTINTIPSVNPINSVNSVNNFYSMNNYRNVFRIGMERYELVIEGTNESVVTTRTHWDEYYFKRKPSKLDQFPQFIPFYQYYLDDLLVQSFNLQYGGSNRGSGRSSSRKRYEVTMGEGATTVSAAPNGTNSTINDSGEGDSTISAATNTKDSSNSMDSVDSSMGEGAAAPGEGATNTMDNNMNSTMNSNEEHSDMVVGKERVDGVLGPFSVTEKYIFDILRMLLIGSEEVKKLMYDPFEGSKPKYTRVLIYKYYFSAQLRGNKSNNWYYRSLITELIPPLSYSNSNTINSTTNSVNSVNSVNRMKSVGDDSSSDTSVNTIINTNTTNNSTNNTVNSTNNSNNSSNSMVNSGVSGDLVHVVHVVPASNHPGVPLDMADSFNHKLPNVDGIIITSK